MPAVLFYIFILVFSEIVNSQKPIALHQLVIVDAAGELLVRLTSYDKSGLYLNYTITSTPTGGSALYQLSPVFNTYGYNPIAGEVITGTNTVVTGTTNRVYYKRPNLDVDDHKMVINLILIRDIWI